MVSQLFFFISILSSLILTHSQNTQCLDDQKSLLLQFRSELIYDPYSSRVSTWNRTDECCQWCGVVCSIAGYVTSLQLDEAFVSGGIGDSSTLFNFKYLEKLNLAYNSFSSTPIPKGIQKLTYLTHLNLSNAGFGGQVPDQISSLRRLVCLDISSWDGALELENPNLEMLLQNVAGLRELYLDGIDMSSEENKNWSHIIPSYLPNLTALSLRDCHISGPLSKSFWQLHSLSILLLDRANLSTEAPESFTKFPRLTTLSLRLCDLRGSFPNMIFHIPTLQNLDLGYNYLLNGSLPPFSQNTSLKSINLASTNFSGSIPSSISNLKNLSSIDLRGCQFTGLPSSFSNLTQLIFADLAYNLFTGSLSSTVFQGLSNLVTLDLSGNRYQGPIPDSLFRLENLRILLLSNNFFNDTFHLEKIQGLANLARLDLSRNSLSVNVSSKNLSTYGVPNLQWLNLASCNVYEFPEFIRHSNALDLVLSNNRIGGGIPSWVWETEIWSLDLSFNLLTHLQKPYHIHPSLYRLNLDSNQLREELPLLIPDNSTYGLGVFTIANNSFSGTIPTSLCNATYLYYLDMSVNKLSGSIPSCLLGDSMNLGVLALGQNNISGPIPDNFHTDYCRLSHFDLSNNTIEGKIPKSLQSCKVEFLIVGNNIINDTFPCMLISSSLRVLVLSSNRFHGEVVCLNKSCPNLQILDISSNHFSGSLEYINFSSWTSMMLDNDAQSRSGFWRLPTSGITLPVKGLELELNKISVAFSNVDFSSNNFKGEIPNAIGNLTSLHLLNLSHNSLHGSIPKLFGKLRDLESLDISQNQVTGVIPMELAELTFLSFLNLSYNKLVGEIPNGRQLQTFTADSFKGNLGLCGFNLNISCNNRTNEHEKVEEKKEIEWEYVSAALGYVVGIGIITWILVFCRSFRLKYFNKIDGIVEDMFDARDRRKKRARRGRVAWNGVRRQ